MTTDTSADATITAADLRKMRVCNGASIGLLGNSVIVRRSGRARWTVSYCGSNGLVHDGGDLDQTLALLGKIGGAK